MNYKLHPFIDTFIVYLDDILTINYVGRLVVIDVNVVKLVFIDVNPRRSAKAGPKSCKSDVFI
jgi:hypothetical protein